MNRKNNSSLSRLKSSSNANKYNSCGTLNINSKTNKTQPIFPGMFSLTNRLKDIKKIQRDDQQFNQNFLQNKIHKNNQEQQNNIQKRNQEIEKQLKLNISQQNKQNNINSNNLITNNYKSQYSSNSINIKQKNIYYVEEKLSDIIKNINQPLKHEQKIKKNQIQKLNNRNTLIKKSTQHKQILKDKVESLKIRMNNSTIKQTNTTKLDLTKPKTNIKLQQKDKQTSNQVKQIRQLTKTKLLTQQNKQLKDKQIRQQTKPKEPKVLTQPNQRFKIKQKDKQKPKQQICQNQISNESKQSITIKQTIYCLMRVLSVLIKQDYSNLNKEYSNLNKEYSNQLKSIKEKTTQQISNLFKNHLNYFVHKLHIKQELINQSKIQNNHKNYQNKQTKSVDKDPLDQQNSFLTDFYQLNDDYQSNYYQIMRQNNQFNISNNSQSISQNISQYISQNSFRFNENIDFSQSKVQNYKPDINYKLFQQLIEGRNLLDTFNNNNHIQNNKHIQNNNHIQNDNYIQNDNHTQNKVQKYQTEQQKYQFVSQYLLLQNQQENSNHSFKQSRQGSIQTNIMCKRKLFDDQEQINNNQPHSLQKSQSQQITPRLFQNGTQKDQIFISQMNNNSVDLPLQMQSLFNNKSINRNTLDQKQEQKQQKDHKKNIKMDKQTSLVFKNDLILKSRTQYKSIKQNYLSFCSNDQIKLLRRVKEYVWIVQCGDKIGFVDQQTLHKFMSIQN